MLKRTAIAGAMSVALAGNLAAHAKDVTFAEITLPVADPTAVTVSASVTVDGGAPQALSFTELFRTGDSDNGHTYGLMLDYLGNPALSGTGDPYICSGNADGVEVSGTDFSALLEKNGKTSFAKHYAMGRFSHELGYVMPDKKTVYLTDDGTNDTLFMFVANEPARMSSGTLYAARWHQTSGQGGRSAQLKWINLGSAKSQEIIRALLAQPKFSDIFDLDTPNCTQLAADDIVECIELKPGMDQLASRLEARRYAALKGATHEFRKMEGFTFDGERNQAFIAISEVGRGMLDNTGDPDKGGRNYDDRNEDGVPETGNHIRVAKPDYCGAVYSMDMVPGIEDTNGEEIESDYVAVNMTSILASGSPGGELSPEDCAANNDVMAQPDNITMIKKSDTLVIGEDGDHTNNMVWAYNLHNGDLTRIAPVPVGAETTSPYFHKVGDATYMTLVAQHPDPSPTNTNGDSITGVIGPIDLGD
ncbi:MAG: DUF839 domain-containing protein [Pseudomonadota bacterium]|nr:DUF839 domain-containing protein [Pseudomonadota bacterium]